MFHNGIIVQGNDVLPYIDQQSIKAQHYRGIYSGITWPLDAMDDIESVNLSNELFECWMQHFEEWIYDASSNIVTYYNRLQRLK